MATFAREATTSNVKQPIQKRLSFGSVRVGGRQTETSLPFLGEALRAGEKRLTEALKKESRISIYGSMSEGLIEAVEKIDHRKFRSELQYTRSELMKRNSQWGFTLFMLTCNDAPTAFLYLYPVTGGAAKYYLDSVATLIEGKGVGSVLVTLALLYCFHKGGIKVELSTEHVDEKGRRLVKFYDGLGFQLVNENQDKGVEMCLDLEPSKLSCSCRKYLGLGVDINNKYV